MKSYYVCDVCGKSYDTVEAAAECERVHAEKKAHDEDLAREKKERMAEVNKAYEHYVSLSNKYFEDYIKPERDASCSSSFDWLWNLHEHIFS